MTIVKNKRIIIKEQLKKDLSDLDASKSLYDSIKNEIKSNDNLEIDFKDAPIKIVAILNDSIGKILLEEEDINKRKKIVDQIVFSNIENDVLLNNLVEIIENSLNKKLFSTKK